METSELPTQPFPTAPATAGLTREEVHEALEALYDNVALGRCAITQRFAAVMAVEDMPTRAQRLRAVLLEALEVLRPTRRGAFASREARSCDVLTLRYVERLGIPEMMEELSLGRRQVFRDLSAAEERLAAILAEWAGGGDVKAGRGGAPDSLSGELAVLASQPAPVRLAEVTAEAMALVAPLARALGVSVEVGAPDPETAVIADRAILKQVLTQALSWCVQQPGASVVRAATASGDSSASLTVLLQAPVTEAALEALAEARRIAGHEGMTLEARLGGSVCELRLVIRRRRPFSVLVVEDNPGAVDLYRRYLSGGLWQLQHVVEPRLTQEVARRQRPDVIILDIMMPKMDGWSVLQGLRQHEETHSVPVIICSVVEDRELSRVLGATACLKKPVSQADLLAALHLCLSSGDGATGTRA
ncbi:MAG: response regulator [Anaerolineae bacterium]